MWVYLLHIFVFSVFLAYIGIVQHNIPKWLYPVILALGIIVIVYHSYKALSTKDAWIHYIHILLIGPLLIYIGWMNNKTDTKAFLVSIMIAGATFAYHVYRVLVKSSYI
jgi:hypothetical protein